jgi:hypothetical protein
LVFGVVWLCVGGSKRGDLEQCAKVLIKYFFFFFFFGDDVVEIDICCMDGWHNA